jgi:hypothetical protein
MSNQLYRAEHYRDLAEECRRLAVTSFSAQMRNRYWRMAENYRMLAEAEERGELAHGGLAAPQQIQPNGWCLARAAYRQAKDPRAVRPCHRSKRGVRPLRVNLRPPAGRRP